MRNLLLAIAATGAVLIGGALIEPAHAMAVGSPTGLRAAVDEINATTFVHCAPGWRHHLARWGWWDGCRAAPLIVVRPRPRLWVAPRRRVIIVR